MIAQFNGFDINPIHLGDAWKVCNFCVANEDRLKRYFPKTLKQNLNPTLSNYFVESKVKAFENKDEFLYTLKHSETRELAGLIYLKELNWDTKQGEFAYCIGYAFEDLGLETLQIITHKDNLGSVKVALKNDFKWVKTLVNGFTPTGESPLDMELYELVSDSCKVSKT